MSAFFVTLHPGFHLSCHEFFRRLNKNLHLTLPRVFGKQLILKTANFLSEKKKILSLTWFQAEIFSELFSVFDLNRIAGISNINVVFSLYGWKFLNVTCLINLVSHSILYVVKFPILNNTFPIG